MEKNKKKTEFGYAFMKGQNGMEGYIRDTAGKRMMQARGIPAGETCELYALTGSFAKKCGRAAADQSGQCRIAAADPGALFAVVNGRVRLWEGGDETYLRACAFLEKQATQSAPPHQPAEAASQAAKPSFSPAKETDAPQKEEENKSEKEEKAEKKEKKKEKENEKERPYVLRPAGTGENVDTLPPRRRSGAAKP